MARNEAEKSVRGNACRTKHVVKGSNRFMTIILRTIDELHKENKAVNVTNFRNWFTHHPHGDAIKKGPLLNL